MNEFENKMIKGIHVSRYVASWVKEGGTLDEAFDKETDMIYYPFERWLKSIPFKGEDGSVCHLSNEEARFITYFATNGKMELESLARKFINDHNG